MASLVLPSCPVRLSLGTVTPRSRQSIDYIIQLIIIHWIKARDGACDARDLARSLLLQFEGFQVFRPRQPFGAFRRGDFPALQEDGIAEI